MKQKEQLETIRDLLHEIELSLMEIENSGNIAFFKALVQKKTIELYELSGKLGQASEKPPIHAPKVKIVSQDELLGLSPEPDKKDLQLEKTPEPIKSEHIVESKTETPAIRTPETKVPETAIQEPIAEEPKQVLSKTPAMEPEGKTMPKIESSVPTSNGKITKDIDDSSLNAKLSKNIKPVVNIVEKSKDTPISDLAKAISISKKFEFIKVLFDGDSETYKTALNVVQHANGLDEAISYLNENILTQFDWTSEESEPLGNEFKNLVRRRHQK